jgi:magnesium-transporting ATPase (P-type)
MESSVYFEKVILSHFEVFYLQGAPETIQERLVQIPAGYIEAYKQFTRQGSRVLALAYKLLPDMAVSFSLFHMKNCANHLMTMEKQCVS